jgi:hypothetical protein
MSNKKLNRKLIKAAIPGSGGLIAQIAKKTGYSWGAVRDFIARDPELTTMRQDEEETIDDMAEATVITQIKDGNEAAARWWLARRRRTKYGDNVDVTSANEKIQPVVFDYDKLIENLTTRPTSDSSAPGEN